MAPAWDVRGPTRETSRVPLTRRAPRSHAGRLAAFLLFLAARGFFSPASAACGFGIPPADAADAVFMHIKAGRDLGFGLVLLGLLVLRDRAALAATVASSLVIPINDGIQVMAHEQNRVAYALAVHGSAVLYGVVLLVLLLRRPVAPR